MIGPSRLRFALGVCLLAAGLLMGAGGAVAVADPDSSGSTTASSGAKGPKKEPGGTKKQPPTGAKSPKKEAGGAEDETNDSGLVAAVTNPVATVPNVAVAPVTNAVAPVTNAVAPVTNAVAPVSDAVAPVSDVIASIQDMLTPVAGAVVPLTQLQSDLFSFLLGIAGVQPVVGGIDGRSGLSAAAGASVASRLPLVLPLAGISGLQLAGISGLQLAGISGVPLTGNPTGVATLDVIALGRASSLPGTAPLAPNGARPTGVRSFLQHALHDLPLAASLWALAAAALPGAGGLVILTAAGGARRIPPGQSRFRIADGGHGGLRSSGGRSVRGRSFGVIGCHPSEGIACRPSGGVKCRCVLDEVA